jgi:hypothetical protein
MAVSEFTVPKTRRNYRAGESVVVQKHVLAWDSVGSGVFVDTAV